MEKQIESLLLESSHNDVYLEYKKTMELANIYFSNKEGDNLFNKGCEGCPKWIYQRRIWSKLVLFTSNSLISLQVVKYIFQLTKLNRLPQRY